MAGTTREWLRKRLRIIIHRIGRRVPPGFRLALGLSLMVLGVFGFLPVLGFWMLPLGYLVALLDLRAIRRWWRRRQAR